MADELPVGLECKFTKTGVYQSYKQTAYNLDTPLFSNHLRFINILYLNKKSKFLFIDTGTLLNVQMKKLADSGYIHCLRSLGTLCYVELYRSAFF